MTQLQAVKAEIERQRQEYEKCPWDEIETESVVEILTDLLSFIESLEKELKVDLEKELKQWRHEHFKGKRDGDYNGEYLERESQLDLAHHFWNKGYNARKEE